MSDNQEEKSNVVSVDFGKGRQKKPEIEPVAVEKLPAGDGRIKLTVFSMLIAESMVLVRFTTRASGIVIPEGLKARPVEALNFSHHFGVADFAYDEHGVRATLSFKGAGRLCSLPWVCVYGMESHKTGEAILWPLSMPAIMKEGG